jgi:hypothetical protein
MPPSLASVLKLVIPALVAAATAYGAIAVERDHNAQDHADLAIIKAAAPQEAAWHQHVEDRFEEQRAALERIERAVGSK